MVSQQGNTKGKYHNEWPSTPERDHAPAHFPSEAEKQCSFLDAKFLAQRNFEEAWDVEDVPDDFFTDT